MYYFIPLLLAFASATSWSGVLPNSIREQLLQNSLAQFWGRAMLPDGTFAQPRDEQERKTLPISTLVANQVFDVGEISGYAQWCGLDWKSNFLTMTAAARKSGFQGKQRAFISVIHGAAQATVEEVLRSKTCSTQERAKVVEMLRRSPNKSF